MVETSVRQVGVGPAIETNGKPPSARYHDLLLQARQRFVEAGGLAKYNEVLARANELIHGIYWDGFTALGLDRRASETLATLVPVAEVQRIQRHAADKRQAVALQRQQLVQVRQMLEREKQAALAALHQALVVVSGEYRSLHEIAAAEIEAEIRRRTEDLAARLDEERSYLRQYEPGALHNVRDGLEFAEPEKEQDAERGQAVELAPSGWWSKDGNYARLRRQEDVRRNAPSVGG